MLRTFTIFCFIFLSIFLTAQVNTGLYISGQVCSTCVNEINEYSGFTHKCGENKLKRAVIRLPHTIKLDYYGVGVSYYLKHDFIDIYENLVFGGGVAPGFNYNYFKTVNYTNGHYPGALYEASSLRSYYFSNDIFVYTKLMKWLYIEAGLHNRVLLYRKFPKGFGLFKHNKYEKEQGIPILYNSGYISIGIEIKGVQLKYRYINFNKNILVEFTFEASNIEERNPIITKFEGASELVLSIPLYNIKKIKLPYFKP